MNENAQIRRLLTKGLEQPVRTQRGLARALGIDPASVNRIFKGKRKLAVREFEPAARYLGIPELLDFCPREQPVVQRYLAQPPELRDDVLARALDLGIEPEEFLARAVRGAINLLGARRERR